jgi:hypothetical protein
VDLKQKLSKELKDWKFIAALVLILAMSEVAPHLEPVVRTYKVETSTTLGASGNVSYGISSWNFPPLAEWLEGVNATSLAMPFAVLGGSRR